MLTPIQSSSDVYPAQNATPPAPTADKNTASPSPKVDTVHISAAAVQANAAHASSAGDVDHDGDSQ